MIESLVSGKMNIFLKKKINKDDPEFFK